MAINSKEDRKRAFDAFIPWASMPLPEGEIDPVSRAHIWSQYISGSNPLPDSPYYIDDYVARALALMIEQFKPADKLKALITAIVDQLQECEDVMNDLLVRRLLQTAEGTQLDGYGEILGEPRRGRNDDDYREALYEKIFINIANGEPETMIRVLKFLTEATQVRYFEPHPAAVSMYTNGTVIPDNLLDTVRAAGPASIELSLTAGYGIPLPFSFDGEGGIPFTEGLGFSETNYTEGGNPIGGQMVETIS